MKVLDRSGTLHSRSSGNKEVTIVIVAVNADGGKSLIYMVEILLDIMLMSNLINALHLLLDIRHKPFLTVNYSWNNC